MPERNDAEQLDRLVEAIVASGSVPLPDANSELAGLTQIAADLRGLPRQDFKARLKAEFIRRPSMASKSVLAPDTSLQPAAPQSEALPADYHTITPYLIVRRASDFIGFLKAAFGGVERFRVPIKGSDLIMHAEVGVGNSVIELADANQQHPPAPATLHLYVSHAVDEVFAAAVAAGATAVHAPTDVPWGDRLGTVKDQFGNVWYVSMPKTWSPGPEGLRSIQPYLHVDGADTLIRFLQEAFGADAQGVAKSPEGKVLHATIQIGDWTLEVDDAHGDARPMPCHLHLHVPDADRLYARAIRAGATSIEAPSDKPYGRSGGVRDAFGNSWYITTHPGEAVRAAVPAREDSATRQKSEFEGRKPMSTAAKPVAEFHAFASPRLSFKDAAKAIEFYKRALGARETFRFEAGGHVAHAEIAIGDSVIMLSEEWPEGGRFSAETLGNSPIWLSLRVDDVDALAEKAIAAGMNVKRPIQDQFYGHRDVLLTDPFGYTWSVFTVKEEMSVEEMRRRMDEMATGQGAQQEPVASRPRLKPIPEGFHTVQPYMIAEDGPALLEFAKRAFGAEEILRAVGPAGGLHGEVRIGDSVVMMGGGIAGKPFSGKANATALHVYVEDTDAAYAKALEAGAVSLSAPQDHEYGERGAGVKDFAGNFWYIATHKGRTYIPKGLNNVNVYLHPLRAEPLIAFMKQVFGASELGRYASPDGVVHHAEIRLGTSVVEMGEAHGQYQPMSPMMYLYVLDADAVYRRALSAGAKSIQEPIDQPYGDRNAGVADAFGNTWYIATRIRDVHS
jgi:PhnB protein